MGTAILGAKSTCCRGTYLYIEMGAKLPTSGDKRYEIIDGELREKPPMGAKGSRIATILGS